ncbi:hypothetical protein NL676_010963 [Syzygium grande]|nr:hypothetical protein NL676_010963 [Syzygium grande]
MASSDNADDIVEPQQEVEDGDEEKGEEKWSITASDQPMPSASSLCGASPPSCGGWLRGRREEMVLVMTARWQTPRTDTVVNSFDS